MKGDVLVGRASTRLHPVTDMPLALEINHLVSQINVAVHFSYLPSTNSPALKEQSIFRPLSIPMTQACPHLVHVEAALWADWRSSRQYQALEDDRSRSGPQALLHRQFYRPSVGAR